ncbi:LysE family translocator [Brenneria uluponensis]|uniref:LysE family translocator n=1 Tax=Brenneria uluponensis TaxID=3057057 RepID=UPI0028E7FE02|nr:LysE family translocator [Brenneria ulupoensis]
MTLDFLLTSLLVVISPGTGVLYTMASGLSQGARASVIATVGCTLGAIPHLIAAISGLAILLYTHDVAFHILKYFGVIYLLYMAWGTLKEGATLQVNDNAEAVPAWRVVTSGILLNLLNPKLTLFFFAFLPQFITPGRHATSDMIELGLIFIAMTFIVFMGYGFFAVSIRHHVISRPSILIWMRRSFAFAFVLLGIKLASSAQ